MRLVAFAFCLLLLAGQAGAGTRGVTVEIKSDDGATTESVDLYGASYALVIGIDAYSNGWPRLGNAISDAEAVADVLRELGFDVTIATNLESEGLRRTLKEFLVRKGSDPEARLFVWYAGHGYSSHGEGFLVPAEAPPPDDPDFALYSLPLRDVGTLVRLARAKHVLAVFDSCFAGTIFETRGAPPPPAITRATLMPVRQFLSSGDAEQSVSDDGSFRQLFVRAVRGEDNADANGDGYLTGSELGSFLADRVTNLTNGAQTPRYGKLLDVNFDRGDFVFTLPLAKAAEPKAAAAPDLAETPATGSTAAAYELAFWDAIKSSTNAADYEAYLEAYPEGTFAPLARARAGTLNAGAGEAATAVAVEQPTAVEPEPAVAPEPEPEPAVVAMATPEPVEPATPPALDPIDADYTVVRNANVRAAPSTEAPRVANLPAGTVVRVTGRVKGAPWLAIVLPNATVAYVHADLLREGLPEPIATTEPSAPPEQPQATAPAAATEFSADNPFAAGSDATSDTFSADNPFANGSP